METWLTDVRKMKYEMQCCNVELSGINPWSIPKRITDTRATRHIHLILRAPNISCYLKLMHMMRGKNQKIPYRYISER